MCMLTFTFRSALSEMNICIVLLQTNIFYIIQVDLLRFEFSQDKQRYYVITNHYLSLSFCKRIYIRIYSFILNAKIYFEVFTSKGKSFKIEYI